MKYMYIFDNDPEFFEYLDIFFWKKEFLSLEKEITKNHAYFYFISFIFFFTVIQQVIMGRIGGQICNYTALFLYFKNNINVGWGRYYKNNRRRRTTEVYE